MKNMKKTYILFFTTILALLASCTDLDVTPKHLGVAEVVFTSQESYKQYLAKLYAGLAVTGQEGPAGQGDISGIDEGFSSYLRGYWKAQELPTDEAVIAWGDDGIRDFHAMNWTAQNQFITALYYRIFYQISLANFFIRETTDAKLTERGISDAVKAEIGFYRAEARFLRALSYWHGLDLFGNVILVDENFALGTKAPEQATRQQVFDYVESELLAIESLLKDPKTNQFGRADKAAAWTLLAKLYLNAAVYTGTDKYTNCITYSKKVIDAGYTLDTKYKNLFNLENVNSQEIIFRVNFDGLKTRTWGGMTFLIHAAVGGSMDATKYGIDGGWFGVRTTSALVDRFPDATGTIDQRAILYTTGQTKAISDITNFNHGYAVPKFQNVNEAGEPGSHLTFPDTDFGMFRLGDVYLMYAEAVLRGGTGGSSSQALTYINELRQRAYGNTNGNITSGQMTLQFILDERSRELYFEAHRRTDLIRFNQFTENGIWPWKGNVPAGKVVESFRNLYPLPSSELVANPNLDQNSGY
jgi:starch-binding outer membrane protein, SusD/RagB family